VVSAYIDRCGPVTDQRRTYFVQLVLCDPEGISYILQKRIYDYRAYNYAFFTIALNRSIGVPDHSKVVRPRVGRLLGKGLGWVEGEDEHKRMRRMVSPSFTCVRVLRLSLGPLLTWCRPENIKAMSSDIMDAATVVFITLQTR
jgi:hypothetical protein